MENKHTEVQVTDWWGRTSFSINVPNKCDTDLKCRIISFMSGLDDHDGMAKLREIWNIDYKEWDYICNMLGRKTDVF